MEKQETKELSDREQAARRILYALRNALVLMSVPMREEAIALARQYNITAEELLEVATHRARNA